MLEQTFPHYVYKEAVPRPSRADAPPSSVAWRVYLTHSAMMGSCGCDETASLIAALVGGHAEPTWRSGSESALLNLAWYEHADGGVS